MKIIPSSFQIEIRHAIYYLCFLSSLFVASPVFAIKLSSSEAGYTSSNITSESDGRKKLTPNSLNGQFNEETRLVATFQTPITPQQFLQNFKSAIEQNVFLDNGFYDDVNFRKVIGNYAYYWGGNTPERKFIQFSPLPSSSQDLSGCLGESVIVWIYRPAENEGDFTLNANIRDADPSCQTFSANLIKTFFGNPEKVTELYTALAPPPHGQQLEPGKKTDPFGFTDMEYRIQTNRANGELTFEIRGDGVARNFRFRIKGQLR